LKDFGRWEKVNSDCGVREKTPSRMTLQKIKCTGRRLNLTAQTFQHTDCPSSKGPVLKKGEFGTQVRVKGVPQCKKKGTAREQSSQKKTEEGQTGAAGTEVKKFKD